MKSKISLTSGRGTELRKNSNSPIQITLTKGDAKNIRLLVDDTFSLFAEVKSETNSVEIPQKCNYWIINLSETDAEMELSSENPIDFDIIYDPYLLEKEDKSDFDAEEMRIKFGVPDGFIDTLPKWYSIKFTYPDYNLIFVRPGIGISVQSHEMRNEHWEIVSGNPHIIVGKKIYYSVAANTKFDIPIGTEHTIINPNLDIWTCLKEKYTGTFDEKDIARIYNPNNYK